EGVESGELASSRACHLKGRAACLSTAGAPILAAVQRLLRRFRYGKPIVVVSGLPRSGTSMAMKMLEAGGLPVVTDGRRSADEDNPRGYYEDERVKDLYREGDKTWVRESRGKAIKVISFLLKSLPPDNNYKVLFMHR